jgi:CheY-like chemotaxis protein
MDSVREFSASARSLARNPLGIIALFIVLVYGLAALVTMFSENLITQERLPLIYFLVLFPIIVLCVFAWLVSQHSLKLFAPSDFRDEANYVRVNSGVAIASLTVAASKDGKPTSPEALNRIVETVEAASVFSSEPRNGWRNHVLWVDDKPNNNIYERQAFEQVGLRFTLVESTSEALSAIKREKFSAVISDMGRREGPQEGYVLLEKLRSAGIKTPLFFYAGSGSPEHRRLTKERGGQGCTDDAQELFQMVTKAVVQQ